MKAVFGFLALVACIRLAGWVLLDDFTWGMAAFSALWMATQRFVSLPPEKPSEFIWPPDPEDHTVN